MKRNFRVVSRASDGSFLMNDFVSEDALVREFEQIGMDDCHTDLTIRGLPVLRGLVGPMADGKHVRYETPEVFEELTKQWAKYVEIQSTSLSLTSDYSLRKTKGTPSTGCPFFSTHLAKLCGSRRHDRVW